MQAISSFFLPSSFLYLSLTFAIQRLSDRTPRTRNHDGRFHTVCKFDRLFYYYYYYYFRYCSIIRGKKERERLKLTSRTVSAQLPIDQAWSLVRLRASMSLYFPSVRFWAAEEIVYGVQKGEGKGKGNEREK